MRALATYPALAAVRMPRSAVIVAVHAVGLELPNGAAVLVVEYDVDDQETVERHFVTLSCAKGTPVPARSGYVSSWRRHPAHGGLAALYERFDTDVPADLDPERHADYRLLVADGFVLRDDKAWTPPADAPPGQLSHDQMVAVVRLQEHGYGDVIDA